MNYFYPSPEGHFFKQRASQTEECYLMIPVVRPEVLGYQTGFPGYIIGLYYYKYN